MLLCRQRIALLPGRAVERDSVDETDRTSLQHRLPARGLYSQGTHRPDHGVPALWQPSGLPPVGSFDAFVNYCNSD